MVTTSDNFQSFGPHSVAVARGAFGDVNNQCVVRAGPSDWWMVFTAAFTNSSNHTQNQPSYARSADGVHWTPNSADTPYMLKISGYDLAGADINGTNAIFKDQSGTWHLFFNDTRDNSGTLKLHHATSSDGINYVYQGNMPTGGNLDPGSNFAIQDVRSFTYGGAHFVASSYAGNANASFAMSSSTADVPVQTSTADLQALFPPTQVVVPVHGSTDDYVAVTSSIVQDGIRIYGILYGACSNDSYCDGTIANLADNRIFARWAQKSVFFLPATQSSIGAVGAFGPDIERMGGPLLPLSFLVTGRFTVYDTDGSSLLYQSSPVSTRAGDVWSYSAPQPFATCTSDCTNKCAGASDGCGAICQFNQCAANDTCPGDSAGNCQPISCIPKTCASVGASCGSIADGCNGTLNCGNCSGFNTCGGGGTANVCGCTPVGCTSFASTCGSLSDGCGGTIQCGCDQGVCQSNHTCGCPAGQHMCTPGCAKECD